MRIREIVHYSVKTYRKSREMNVINHEKIVRDDSYREPYFARKDPPSSRPWIVKLVKDIGWIPHHLN